MGKPNGVPLAKRDRLERVRGSRGDVTVYHTFVVCGICVVWVFL